MANTWSRSPDALWRIAPSFLALANAAGNRLEVLGPGGDVWLLLADPATERTLIDLLAERYSVEGKAIADDVSRLLGRLHDEGFVICNGR